MKYLLLLYLFAICLIAQEEIVYENSKEQSTLLELFTSEGCSSCPPADVYLNSFMMNENLWQNIFPVSFHVDYWDYLGWKDIFAKQQYSQRQRKYARSWRAKTVYTPGFILHGREWRNWRKQKRVNIFTNSVVGTIKLHVKKATYTIHFYPENQQKDSSNYQYNLAILGNGITSQVTSGENSGEELKHDFVVLKYYTGNMDNLKGVYQKTLDKPSELLKSNASSFAIVSWISNLDDMVPIQVTGGFIDVKDIILK